MSKRAVRYAVIGLGHIAQVAVLPAFAHAAQNSQVTALVSGTPTKLKQVGKRYGIPHTYSYRDYDRCLNDGHVDAVYIALPNSMHCEYAVRAARAGIHVLCEKPMAMTTEECRQMIKAAKQARVKLMVAYRLHFEEANMTAVDLIRSGQLGPVRLFNSVFAMQVRSGDIRVKRKYGGGTLYDIGVYCINAARYLFGEDPLEVSAFAVSGVDRRFKEVDVMTGALLRFPQDRLGTFVCSFGTTDVSAYEVVGTKGRIRVEPAYEYVGELNDLSSKVRTMLLNALRAYATDDVALLDQVIAADAEVDAIWKAVRRRLKETMRKDPDQLDAGYKLMQAFHHLEYVGDHAVSIAERLEFVRTGNLVRFNRAHI